MEIKIALDLPSIIAQAVSAERIQPIVDKAVTEAISSAVRSATDYSSDFRKALETQLKEAMPHGLDIGDVAKFQLMANAAVTEAVKGANAETIQAAISVGLKNVVPDVPARIKLSELIKAAREGFHKEEHEAFYAHFERTDYGYGHQIMSNDKNSICCNGDCNQGRTCPVRLGTYKPAQALHQISEPGTPSSQWRAAGEPDPHGNRYDCERAKLTMGILTDDELANGAFLNYDQPLNIQGIIAGTAHSPIAWMTAVKDRIRWLSRALEKATAATQAAPAAAPVVLPEPVGAIAWNRDGERPTFHAGCTNKELLRLKLNEGLTGGPYRTEFAFTEPQLRALLATGGQAQAVRRGEVLVTVSGFTGSGKSAIAGEIEILCRALGLQVEWPDGESEKNMTHADWTAALEQYKPRVRIVEQNIPFVSKKGLSK